MMAPSSTRLRLARWLGPWVVEVDRGTLRADLLAGLLGAVLVLPQGIAFAALAGLPPAMGLVAAGLPALIAALAGSSRHVATGPTNATSLALGTMLVPVAATLALAPSSGAATTLLVPLALAVTLLVGLLQLGLALLRLGALANFISPSVMLGFTSGAAALIAWYALAGLGGGSGRASPLQVLEQGLSLPALAIGGLTLAVAAAGRRWWRRGPHMLLALAVAIAAAWLLAPGGPAAPFAQAGFERLASSGGVDPLWTVTPAQLLGQPPSAWPDWQAPWAWPAALWAQLPQLLAMALALAIVALGQAMAIAKALAARSGQALDLNRECLGQGLANLGAALAGGMVVCGSLNRSLPNYEAGARTPLAAAAAGLLLIALVALAAPLLAWIPLSGVSALLLVVAWALIDGAAWQRLARTDRTELGIAAATALATLVLRLEVAVLTGVMLSLVAYLWRSSRPALRSMGFDRQGTGQPQRPFVVVDGAPPGTLPECPQLKLLRMEGSVWFGAAAHVAEHLRGLRDAADPQRHLLVMAKSMNQLDLAGADLWDDERLRRRALGGDLYFHRPRPAVLAMWQRTGFLQRLGADHVFPDKHRAIATIVPRLDPAVCARCTVRLFDECAERPGAPLSPSI
ncbi:MAG: SulP family inorganic anion transporter [Burkholderiaceae bacterium]|nr:SulP family inorganic anion transporter [Burkholderiaceae bacterium]